MHVEMHVAEMHVEEGHMEMPRDVSVLRGRAAASCSGGAAAGSVPRVGSGELERKRGGNDCAASERGSCRPLLF